MAETPLLSVGGVDENREKEPFNNKNNEQLNNDEQQTFRNKPIKWTVKYEVKTRTIKSKFDNEPEMQHYTSAEHFISYDGKEYKLEEFLLAMFPNDYKKYEYKVRFFIDDVFWLMSNQRAKLQYDILALNFPLVTVSEQDKRDLEEFAKRYKAETAQRWYNRMQWQNGHEKLITFGVSLDVRAAQGTQAVKDLFCYQSRMTKEKAYYQGVSMNWEQWSIEIKRQLDNGRKRLSYTRDKEKRQVITDETLENANKALYYQDKCHLTMPKAELDKIQVWIYKYLKDGKATFPFQEEIPNANVSFTIDFAADCEIYKTRDLKKDMGEYNKENNAQHNKDLGRKRVLETFSRLKGDEWTTQEIMAQGFNDKNIKRFVEYELIKCIGRGKYIRLVWID